MDLCFGCDGGGETAGGKRLSCLISCHGILAGFQLHPDLLFVLDCSRRNVRVQLWEFTSLAEVPWTHPSTGEQHMPGNWRVLAGPVVGKALPRRSSELQRAVLGLALSSSSPQPPVSKAHP